jgi:NADPH-dependent 2,4-dienoyl-CoA reductase/sulfur reductase-like enzyme
VTFLVREKNFWDIVLPLEEAQMINRHILENGVDLRLETELKEILPGDNGRANTVVTNKDEHIECGFVGLTVGVSPNVAFLKDSGIELGRGVMVDEHLQTNVPGIFAAGDCAQLRNPLPGRRPIEAVWYTGRMSGETAARNLIATQLLTPYHPGIWFNSAKFFDIEYQVYGAVLPNPPDNHTSFYWEHPDGRRSIRIVYDRNTGSVLGFNLMGVRFRHEVCEKWLKEATPIETVLQNLGIANFDPEFYEEYEADVVAEFSRQTGRIVSLKKLRGLAGALDFLKTAS